MTRRCLIRFDADNQGRTPPLDANAKRWRKDGARAMTPKEKIKVHVQIERENARKLREWKEGGGNRGKGSASNVA